MRYWLDSEFLDDGRTIDLISIGIVCEDGRELYLQSVEFDPTKASQWVKENVIAHLDICPHYNTRGQLNRYASHMPQLTSLTQHEIHGQCTFEKPAKGITGLSGVKMSSDAFLIGAYADCPWRKREQIKNELLAFMDVKKYGKPEWYAWCGSYDHVALCQLFGTMMDVPSGWPHYIKDLQYVLDERGISDDDLPKQENAHNALADAKHIQRIWKELEDGSSR